MSDHDQTLADQTGDTPFGNPNGRPTSPQVETILSLDEVMTQAKRVERTARICLRADLQAEFNEAVEELSTIVDADGKILADGDQALGDASRAGELIERIEQVRAEMAAATRVVRFRAMTDDAWREFDSAHRKDDNSLKNADEYNNQIIARCAIAPTMTVDDVKALRTKLGPTQVTALANAAYWACTTGGLDVPKSPAFSRFLKPTGSEKS